MYRVLIAEDEASTRKWLSKKIAWQDFGFQLAEVVEHGLDAWAVLQQPTSIDVLLTDIRMPYLDGLELIKRIREAQLDIEVIISSGFGDFDYAQQAIKLGAAAYLLKPVSYEQLQLEFEKLRMTLDQKQYHKSQMIEASQAAKNQENQARSDLFHKLLIRGETVQHLDNMLSKLKVNVPSSSFMMMLGETDEYQKLISAHTGEDLKLCNFIVMNIFTEIMIGYADSEVIYLPDNKYVFLVQLDGRDHVELSSEIGLLLQKALRTYLKLFDITFSFGVSTAIQSVDGLNDAYQQAIKALEHKFFRHYSLISHYSESMIRNEDCRYPIELEKQLLQCIKLNELSDVELILTELFEAFSTQGNPEEIKTIMGEILINMTRSIFELKSMDVKSKLIQSFLVQVKRTETIHDLKNKMRELIDYVLKIVRLEDTSLSPIDKGIAYMKLNLGKEISLQEVAEYAGRSTSYFSTQFKKEKGQNFIDYLITLRMEKSQHLLESTKMTIAQIGELTGYHSYRYFTKVFKEQYGITPTQYREQLRMLIQ